LIVHLIVVGYHTTTTPSSTSSSTSSSTNDGGASRLKHEYENGRGNGTNDSTGQQQLQQSSWSSLVKSESPHGLRGK
jgi:hypothetical protein